MTRLFFDTEFTGLHQHTTLISIGIVAETGQTFYAEFSDYNKSHVDAWLQKNVIDNLILRSWQWDRREGVKNMRVYGTTQWVKQQLLDWLSKFEDGVQMWSDCLAYDWVLFCQIFGHALMIPKNIYYIPFDICPLLLEKVGDADINREEFAGEIKGMKVQKHNALWDAYVIRACYNKLHQPAYGIKEYQIIMPKEAQDQLHKEIEKVFNKMAPVKIYMEGDNGETKTFTGDSIDGAIRNLLGPEPTR